MSYTPQPLDGYLSAAEAAERLDLTTDHVRRLCCAGKVDGARMIAGAWAIPAAWVTERLTAREGCVGVAEAAQMLGTSESYVRTLLARGRLTKRNERNQRTLIPIEDVQREVAKKVSRL